MAETLRDVRLSKLEKLRESGINPYPERFPTTHSTIASLSLQEGTEGVRITGRIMLIRIMGKLTFIHIQDAWGQIQIALSQKDLGQEKYNIFTKLVDIGDFVGVEGKIFKTQTGEQTILVNKIEFLGKALRPLPEKYHGIKDQELCYRQRYLDLLMNPETKERFRKRTKVIRFIREFLDNHGFEEVETPVLQNKPSGALATPFVTHHNTLDIDVYLRIAPETYLKRLIVGGFERVYEFARVFRNEGMDPSHLQDFTMLEYYAAYWNFEDNMDFTEEMVKSVLEKINGNLSLKYGNKVIDFSGKWPRLSFREILLKDCGLDIDLLKDTDSLKKAILEKGIELEKIEGVGWGRLVDQLYKKVSREKMVQPQFLIYHPIELSPLARRNDKNPQITDRFQLVVNGWEIVNAYSELVDPIDQRRRLEEQARLNMAGDDEAMVMDEDYIMAMEHGMPPISGWGMGIDRFVSLITDQENLRDVVFFPLMKPSDDLHTTEDKGQPEEKLKSIGISREEAENLFNKHVVSDNLKKHSLAASAIMKALAPRYQENEEVWELIGLLHDLDFDETQKPDEHTNLSAKILKEAGVNPEAIRTIQSHNGENVGVERKTTLDFALSSAEMITGLIVATALVYPDKKLSSVDVNSIIKRMKKKDFARKVDRAQIQLCEKINFTLEEFCEISLKAMQGISDKLGL